MPLASAEPIAASCLKGSDVKPKPFVPEAVDGDDRFVKDKTNGMIWHRSKCRTLYADTDRSHRKLAHRGSYEGRFWASPATVRRVLLCGDKHFRPRPQPSRSAKRPIPAWVTYRPRQVWVYDTTHFTKAGMAVLAIIETIRKHDQDATGRPQHPIYALQGNFGVARTYAYAGLTDMVGTYVGGAEMTAGAAGGGDRGLTVLDRVEGQSNPVVLAQFNGVHGAGEMRRRLYTALMAGARAMGFWRDCYAPGCRQQWGRSVLPVEETEWWPDFPNLRREIDDLLLLIRQPHWTTWGLTATTSGAVAFGTREYKGEGYVLVANQKTTPASITFTIHDLSYTPESVQDHFSGREVVRVSNETFTVKLAGLGIGQGTAVYRLTKKAVPPQHMTY